MIKADLVKKLREKTGVGMMACKEALREADGDMEKAIDILRKKGEAKALQHAGRAASEGIVASYVHLGGKIGVLLEVSCETDFAAKSKDFQELVKDLTMHIAASNPLYIKREDAPNEVIAKEKKHAFISTGMSSFDDIDRAVEIFRKNQCPFSLLHCVSTYPSEDKECNLLVMNELRNRYKCDVGYSGHEKGILPSVLAVALGATIIERHITLDKKMYGSDQAASLEPAELQELVKGIRAIPAMLGDGSRKVSEKEAAIAKKLRYFE